MLEAPNGLPANLDARGWGLLNFGKGETPAEFITKAKEIAPKDGVRQFVDKAAIRFYMAGGVIHEEWVTEDHKRRYPTQWAAYEQKKEQQFEGTLLVFCPLFSPAQMTTLDLAGFKTVQQFADAPLTAIQACGMGAIDLQKKAKTWLKACEKTGAAHDLANENATLRTEVDILKKQLAELSSRIGGNIAAGRDAWPKDTKEAKEGK